MAPVGHFFGWGVIVQIAAIVHWSRKRPATARQAMAKSACQLGDSQK